MKRTEILLFLCVALPASADPSVDPLQAMAAAYRAGDAPQTLEKAADVLEADPKNREVHHYLWTLGRQMKDAENSSRISTEERQDAVRLAEKDLEARRREAENTLERLKASFEKSRRTQSPQDVLAGADGMGRFLDATFEEERQKALAAGYFRGLVENLTAALKGKAFVAPKDQLVAQAWLAYYTGHKAESLKKWEAAAAEDPSDKEVANNLDQLRRLLRKEQNEKNIRLWESQAETFQSTGFYREALELWEKVLGLEKGRANALRKADECRAAVKKKDQDARLARLTEEGVQLYKDGRVLDAAQVWFRVLEEDPGHRQARVWLTHAGRQLGSMEAASATPAHASTKESTVDVDRRAALELHKQGLIAYAQDHVAEAVDLWGKALEKDPSLTQAQEALRQAKAELSFKKNAGR